jgi:uncharacterized RDD family membrane protein YckC
VLDTLQSRLAAEVTERVLESPELDRAVDWRVTGQRPGLRLMRLRVVDEHGSPHGLGRSILRLVGLFLAIAPLFAGFLPVLFDRRRRGLHDFLAGTVVVYADHDAPPTEPALSAVPGAASSHT